jgi:hypothetical protein
MALASLSRWGSRTALQQDGLDQPLRRDAGPADGAVRLVEVAAHLGEHLIGPPLDLAERVRLPHRLLQLEGHEDRVLPIHSSAHRHASLLRPFSTRLGRRGSLAAC